MQNMTTKEKKQNEKDLDENFQCKFLYIAIQSQQGGQIGLSMSLPNQTEKEARKHAPVVELIESKDPREKFRKEIREKIDELGTNLSDQNTFMEQLM